MLELFDSLVTVADIESLIRTSMRESEVLEFKRGSEPFNDRMRQELTKDVSAMANSSGGVIIFGVETDPEDKSKPIRIGGLSVQNIETFDRVVNSGIQPIVKGIEKRLLPGDDPKVMVVYVPASQESPHQSLPERRYYHRSGLESIPMGHDLVALHFGRRHGPLLSLRFDPLTRPNCFSGDPSFSNDSVVRVLVENKGKRVGRFVAVILVFPGPQYVTDIRDTIEGASVFGGGNARNVDRLYPKRQARQFTESVAVFHPGVTNWILDLCMKISKEFFDTKAEEPLIEWSIYSDNMNAQVGSVSLRQLGWA